ncbi:MAG: hypothetical protein JWN40_3280 [Phycisphaerales bacterium]|nr:hypothetical protein [Phycisphaerales bacterium]
MPPPTRLRRLTQLLLFLILLAIPAALCFARAGGGQSYSGGSHSSGSHSGGGGGDGGGAIYLIFQILRFCFVYPKVGIPILIVVAGGIFYVYRTGSSSYTASVIRRGGALADEQEQSALLAALRQTDPAFDQDAFLARVRVAFTKIQQAWCGQNLAAVRPFISDGVYERFTLQFDEQRAQGLRNQMDDLDIEDVETAGGYADTLFDVLNIRIEAAATDSMVSLKDGQRLSGSTTSVPFVEIWTFLRRRGAKTNADPAKPGLIEGNCPNCGGAIELNQNANCQYCGAILRSGQYDWVLAEITQDCEWQPGGQQRALPGIDALMQLDPGFNLQALEDRASVIFWRLATAERLANTKPLTKAALPDFLERYQADLTARKGPKGERVWQGDRAVGSVDTLGIILAPPPTPGQSAGSASAQSAAPDSSPVDLFDRALLEIRWSGTRFTADATGKIQRHEQSSVSHLLLVLARKPNAKTDTDEAISSAHCPTCGAPEGGGASGVCEFCGATLNDGHQSWALQDATSLNSPKALELLSDMRRSAPAAPAGISNENGDEIDNNQPAPQSPATTLAWMVKMTLADGHLDDKEREMLESYAAQYRIPADRLNQLIGAAQANTLDVPLPADETEARATLKAMARAALADGKISREEQSLLEAAGEHLGLSDRDVSLLLKRTQSELYADARQQLKSKRNGNGQ